MIVDHEIIKAIGLSMAFFGVILSIVAIGIAFFVYKISKKKGMGSIKMAGLIIAWAVFISLSILFGENIGNYKPVFLGYSLMYIITTLLGAGIILTWSFMLPKLLKVFDKKLLIVAGIIATISIIERLIFPFLESHLFCLINRITIIIPPMMGFFMIIKSAIRKGK